MMIDLEGFFGVFMPFCRGSGFDVFGEVFFSFTVLEEFQILGSGS